MAAYAGDLVALGYFNVSKFYLQQYEDANKYEAAILSATNPQILWLSG